MLAQAKRITYFGGNFNAPIGHQNVVNFPVAKYRVVTALAWVNGGWDASVCTDTLCHHVDAYRITLPQ
jgi:hypothetical protein